MRSLTPLPVSVMPEPLVAPEGVVEVSPAEVTRQLQMLAAVARRTGNAVIATSRDGVVEWVNEGFTRLTGFTAAEAIGKVPGRLLQGPDTAPDVRARIGRAVAAGRPFEEVILNYHKCGRQYWVRIEGEPTLDEAGQVTGYMALETDVTEQLVSEGRELVTQRVGERLLTCPSIEEAARIVVEELVRTLDVRAAQVWTVEVGEPTLRYITGASADTEGRDWVEAGAANTFRRGTEWIVGVGAPGVAWGTAAPCQKTDFWVPDQSGQYSRRATAARRARIRTVCAVPVHGPEGVVAVIEIGGSHNYPGYDRLPSLVAHVARQFGAFLLQDRSRKAFELLFQHSPDQLLVVDETGGITRANARAEAVFGAVVGRRLGEVLEGGTELLQGPAGPEGPAVLHQRRALRPDGTFFSAEVSVSTAPMTGAPAHVVSIRDLTERHRAEEALRQSLVEKVTLVQEVHHRVKNNLQIISSLVSLQSRQVEDEGVRAALADTVHRIHSMALVHQQLYSCDDLSRIHFGQYARSLVSALQGSMAPDAVLSFEEAAVEVPLERAVPAGLVLNELLTNAFKYGRNAAGRCVVHVRVERTEGGFAFTVADEGPGLKGTVPRQHSMGQTLIQALVRQLGGTRTVGPSRPEEPEPGTCVRVEAPLPPA